MTQRRKLVVVAILSFFTGGILVGTAASFLFDGILNSLFRNNYTSSFYANAAEAQFEVHSLANLRSGNIGPVISGLDLMLNSHTMYLGAYETAVPAAKRQAFVYRVLSEVRAYRDKYPAHFDYPLQEAEYRKALALGTRPGG